MQSDNYPSKRSIVQVFRTTGTKAQLASDRATMPWLPKSPNAL
ncbi:MAG TPA: hypothetical protein V6D18_17345 [Thermosynechococcaceae cyanobacterium]